MTDMDANMRETVSRRQSAPPAHGGDLDAQKHAPDAFQGEWLDLSTGINPLSWPLQDIDPEFWQRLPDRRSGDNLLAAASRYYGCPPDAGLVALPGTQSAIQMLPRLIRPARVTVLGPTYAEHAYCWRQSGHAVTEMEGLPGNLAGTGILVVVNPNNPDGRVIGRDLLLRWHAELMARGGWLVIDEAFADVMPEVSLAGDCNRPGMVILRSFGKFFGLAGLRLGFALGDPAITAALHESAGPWAVSGPALAIGAAALDDSMWQQAMRDDLRARARRFDLAMRDRGIHVIGGTGLFRLAKVPDAPALATALRKQGVHVRLFADRPHWIRFGIPAAGSEFFSRLDRALQAKV